MVRREIEFRPEPLAPRFILRLDDLPKVIEADGVVWPVYLPLRSAARLFHITPDRLREWIVLYDLPYLKVGTNVQARIYIPIPDLNDWLRERTEHGVPSARREYVHADRDKINELLADLLPQEEGFVDG